MPGYRTKLESVVVAGVGSLLIRSLLDRQQYCDPDGVAERLGIGPAVWPLFGLLWPSAVYLAAQLALRPVRPAERILEIGCGLALASLVAQRRGANITASDRHPLAETFLRENLRLNNLPLALDYRHGQWGDVPPASASDGERTLLSGTYDLIIGSDLLYDRNMASELATFIGTYAIKGTEVWLVDPDRGYRPAFNRHMAALGFELQQDSRLVGCEDPVRGTTARRYKGHLLVYRR